MSEQRLAQRAGIVVRAADGVANKRIAAESPPKSVRFIEPEVDDFDAFLFQARRRAAATLEAAGLTRTSEGSVGELSARLLSPGDDRTGPIHDDHPATALKSVVDGVAAELPATRGPLCPPAWRGSV
jgi:hypothetical protein